MKSPLLLEHFCLDELSFTNCTETEVARDNEVEAEHDVSVDFSVSKHSTDLKFRLILEVEIMRHGDTPCRGLNHLRAVASGYFGFEAGTSDEYAQQVTPLNQVSIVYGMLRGVVASVTGLSNNGPYLLPAVNFIEVLKAKQMGIGQADLARKKVPQTKKRRTADLEKASLTS